MADDSMTDGATGEEAAVAEFRPCSYCGASIHPSSHRCPECCGHVGISWGTVHKELYLFLLSAVLIGVGCIASWTGRAPDGPLGAKITGLDTIRGTFMFAIAIYGVISGVMNLLYRRMVVWPYLLNALFGLWIGLGGVVDAIGSPAWKAWSKASEGKSMMESWFGSFRAIPPAFFLLTLAGAVVMIKLLGGILAAATSGKGKPAPKADATSRRRARGSSGSSGSTGSSEGTSGDAGSTDGGQIPS